MKNTKNLKTMLLGALGIVYGDIGTSPLYALQSCFMLNALPVNETNILGVISLFIWVLLLMTTLKYVYLVLRMSKQGEGGVLVLSLLSSKLLLKKHRMIPISLGIIGAALLLGDGVITPAISVLGALEGMHLITPMFSSKHIIFIAIIILLALFAIQRRGSGIIGSYFGPVMVVWFIVLSILGIYNIALSPTILRAINPYYALSFIYNNGLTGFITLGSTIIVITGAEALYADLGHFNRKPIQLSWTYFVFPALILNYLGQGGLLLRAPSFIINPFYHLAPQFALYPLIILATVATIIASQAIISGVFSITWQGIMLNYMPRMKVIHTSNNQHGYDYQHGQIYVPVVNTILCILTIGAVLHFQSSASLAIAYGLSVAGVMLITSVLAIIVARYLWKWSRFRVATIFLPFLLLDLNFVLTNLVKIAEGAWYTVVITIIVSYIIWVWMRGNRILMENKLIVHEALQSFIKGHAKKFKHKIPGCAIFMSRHANKVPNALALHLRHNKFLHEKVIILSVQTKVVPRIAKSDKFHFKEIYKDIFFVTASFGFQEIPNLHEVTTWAQSNGIMKQDTTVSCFLTKDVPVAYYEHVLGAISRNLYIFLSNNALPAYDFFKVPNQKTVELVIKYRI
jgi:KUP system potassium uptake protein